MGVQLRHRRALVALAGLVIVVPAVVLAVANAASLGGVEADELTVEHVSPEPCDSAVNARVTGNRIRFSNVAPACDGLEAQATALRNGQVVSSGSAIAEAGEFLVPLGSPAPQADAVLATIGGLPVTVHMGDGDGTGGQAQTEIHDD